MECKSVLVQTYETFKMFKYIVKINELLNFFIL
jgi:hypothetical protein